MKRGKGTHLSGICLHGEQGYGRPAWAEVDLGKIAANIKAFRCYLPAAVKLMAVVKANAYGHGDAEVAAAALNAGASMLGVASLEEGINLRRRSIGAPVLILGYTDPAQCRLLQEGKLTPSVFSWEGAQALSRQACSLGCIQGFHFEVDTGMGRLGPAGVRDTLLMLEKITVLPGLKLEGIFTHFACADEREKSFTSRQIILFQDLLKAAAERGIAIPLRHASNTAAAIEYGEALFDMVRLGIGIYGCYPSAGINRQKICLQAALTLKSRIVFLKNVPAGTTVSYGKTYQTPRETRIATVPLGYGDGLSRHLSNRGFMLVRGQRVPIVGRVCMDMTMLDVGALPAVQEGDEAVAYGCQGSEEISVDEVAALSGTISYEILCNISPRVPRLYFY